MLGCGVMAGLGAAINAGDVGRGDSVAVIGCGGVGSAAIAGSRLAGAATIIAIDLDDGKLTRARELGATDTINSSGLDHDGVAAIQELTGGFGADVMVDAVGRPETSRQAFYGRDLAGTVVLVGVPNPQMTIEPPLIDVFGGGGALKSSWHGDCLPSRDFPVLIDLFLQGRLPLDRFVTETIGVEEIEEAFTKMHGARCCARWWCYERAKRRGGRLERRAHRPHRHGGHLQRGRGHLGRRQQRLGARRRHRMRTHRRSASGRAIAELIGGRRLLPVLCAHAHDDHVTVARELADRFGGPIRLHPDDEMLW